MIYVVSAYYIGWGARYDGTGNTDTATISLFKDKNKAKQFILSEINKIIEEDIYNATEDGDTNAEETYKLSDEDFSIINTRLDEYGMYNFRDHIMYCLNEAKLNEEEP